MSHVVTVGGLLVPLKIADSPVEMVEGLDIGGNESMGYGYLAQRMVVPLSP